MRQLHFRVAGLTEKDVQRWRKLTQPSVITAKILAGTMIAATVIYAVGALGPIALIDGEVIRARNALVIMDDSRSIGEVIRAQKVLVIVDISGSMLDSEDQSKLQRQLEQLGDMGMLTDKRTASGFGVSTTANDYNLLNQLERGLEANPNVDAVYAFSDFEVVDKSYWKSDRQGYKHLRELLRKQRLRLYLGTVKYQPPNELIRVAKESGGGVIVNK